jgi:hypothetical protein
MKYIHQINTSQKGGVTVAFDITEHQKGKTLTFAMGQCSRKDQFCKKTGRDMALKHWNSGNRISMVIKGSKNSIKKRLYALSQLAYDLNLLQDANHGV